MYTMSTINKFKTCYLSLATEYINKTPPGAS